MCSFLIFNILYSANAMTVSQEDEWLALTIKVILFYMSLS
jgi:hypothetical protein